MSVSIATTLPRGCEVSGFGFNENYLILNDQDKQSFFLIQNHSNKPINLEAVEIKEVFMSPKLHVIIDPGLWAAFASDIANQHFKCFTTETETSTIVNCHDALQVCQYPRVKFALSNMGNYWVSSNKEQGQVIHDAVTKGILLHW